MLNASQDCTLSKLLSNGNLFDSSPWKTVHLAPSRPSLFVLLKANFGTKSRSQYLEITCLKPNIFFLLLRFQATENDANAANGYEQETCRLFK